MKKSPHYQKTSDEYVNPMADRFKQDSGRRRDGFARTAYVLQGGGSIGAYQMGVLEALLSNGYEPDWVAATSIGAIQAAIVVGNKPEDRIPRLKEFWSRIATYSALDMMGEFNPTQAAYNKLSSLSAVVLGQRGFFNPRWNSPFMQLHGDPSTLSIYDTSPLRQTLLDLVDFDHLNSCKIRLSLGSVCIATGKLIYFNNINYLIKPEHVMASGALPPGFPAIKIADDYFWDGGIHSNSPLEVIIDAVPPADTLCFVIDCFGGSPFTPATMDGVAERMKDITYSTHAARFLKDHIDKQKLVISMHQLYASLDPAQKKKFAEEMKTEVPYHQSIVHITYSARYHRGSAKDYNFGKVCIAKRAQSGYQDGIAVIREQDKWNHPTHKAECRLYEAPNNTAKLVKDF
jgi:NTE family protein